VLTANQEAENGIVTFLRAQERFQWQKKAADAGKDALNTVEQQWQAGVVDFTRVAQLLQNQVQLEDTLAQVQGEIATGLISTYKGLGGGWELRLTGCTPGAPPVPPAQAEPVPPVREDLLPAPRQLDAGEGHRPGAEQVPLLGE
jgi:cell fate (sporulation/competence/biofilm development) regulator YlbF (YheA/YmcA/DUF963 family)